MKICKKCGIEKSLDYFYFRKDSNNYKIMFVIFVKQKKINYYM